MKKKNAAALMAAAMAASLLVGCGGGAASSSAATSTADSTPAESTAESTAADTTADGDETLTVWAWDPNFNIYALKQAEAIYQKDHPNFKLNIEENVYSDIETKLITAATSEDYSTLPDLFLMQDHAHHFLNLVLIGLAVADNSLLDLHRRVFKQLFCIFGAGAQRNPARCRNIHAGGDIL